ncbi:lytic murein transglycosylase [Fundidesulfovibrio putealis]|uniref:lytic murein transglycosylase n=1 Tax=Fundidesulfovibrio putealis TaxID=270496 RepID=UPI0004032F3D|nr:lytic murein transglycosylase [Fundidesulfovibrio putealis]
MRARHIIIAAVLAAGLALVWDGERSTTRGAASEAAVRKTSQTGQNIGPDGSRTMDPVWQPVAERLVREGIPRDAVDSYFSDPSVTFDASIMAHKVDRIVRKRFDPQPAPTKRTLQQSSYGHYLKPWVLAWAGDYARANQAALQKAEAAYGVPQDVIVALLLVETKLGTFLGKDEAFQVLASMAASDSLASIRPYLTTVGQNADRAAYADVSAKDRAEWAYQELKALILHARASGKNPLLIPGSIYGAIGICQFMPTNALRFGVDGDGDKEVDLFGPQDAIPSIANYLVGHGWKPAMNYDQQRTVIYAYNHSDLYSLAVMTVAEKLRQGRTGR